MTWKDSAVWISIVGMLALSRTGVVETQSAGEGSVETGAGKVTVHLPENGSLGTSSFVGGRFLGLRWPGIEGFEFLGSGGVYLQFGAEGEEGLVSISPSDFRPIEFGYAEGVLFEGCTGGKRYPHRNRDDDGDGLVDEDHVDGIDNDGDGLIDEDFAAIGSRMNIARAAEPASGLVLTQKSYRWGYSHVRDFIGFTTIIEYPANLEEEQPCLTDLMAEIYLDFDIGEPDDERRSLNDRFHFLECEIEEAVRMENARRIEVAAAHDGTTPSFCVAAVFLEVSRPGSGADEARAVIREAKLPDGEALASRRVFFPLRPYEEAGIPPDEEAGAGHEEALYDGDLAVVFALERMHRFAPGERIVIEWALVFGKTETALARQIERVVETYRGVEDDDGVPCHWVVPARKAVVISAQAKLSSVWIQGERKPSIAVALPADFEDEELEWLRVAGTQMESYERGGGKIFVSLDEEAVASGEPFTIEGQLAEGTIFIASISRDALRAYVAESSLPPGSLPEESIRLYPNPFLSNVNINVRVDRTTLLLGSDSRTGGLSSVRIYDVQGRLVRTVIEEETLHPGDYALGWDGRDEYGIEVAPGVYYCKLQIGDRSITKRVILLR